ncbi:putative WD40 domain containing protein [Naviculisporaceae sp. PSN 640]
MSFHPKLGKLRSGQSVTADSPRDLDGFDENQEAQPGPASIKAGSSSNIPYRSNSTQDASTTSKQTFDSPSGPLYRELATSDTSLLETTRGSFRRKTAFRRKSPVPEDPLGLILVHGTGNSEADIIFVHGLGGSCRKTWSRNRDPDIFWPAWIRHEEGLSKFRAFTFGYNANFRDSDTRLSILDFSKSLLVHMKAFGTDNSSAIGLRPIVFVTHSMGGLVVKKALMMGKSHDQYAAMLAKVHGIMFLSTPHKGSSHANTLNSLLSLFGSSTKVYVSELDPNSTSIEDITEQFRGICGSWELVSLYETRMTKLSPGIKKMVVNKDSGILNYPKEITVPVDADHHTICKFHSRLDPNYRLVIDLLRQITSGIRSQSSKALVRLPSITTLSRQDSAKANEIINYAAMLEKILGIKGTPQGDLDSHLSQALPGSCQWLHRIANFRSWLESSGQDVSILWLAGLPGTGTSTLAAKTIDHIQRALHKSSCQYHFFTETQPVKRTVAYCLRAVACQLANTHRGFADKLIKLHCDTGFTATNQKLGVIWETIFENIVFKMDFGHTLHWVFDGMDESDAPKLLVRNLLQIKSQNCIKILLLSRPEKELASLITAKLDLKSIIQVTPDDTQGDIEEYISSITSEILPNDDDQMHQYIVQEICRRAEGSFLWTKLALDTLRDNWHTQADIEISLNNVPDGMHSLYQRMMANVCSQQSRQKEIAFRILTWASCAFRPLTIAELTAALQPEYDGFISLAETVAQICGQFVRVDGVRICPLCKMPNRPANDRLAIGCLQYLSQDHWRRKLSTLSEDQQRVGECSGDSVTPPSNTSSASSSLDRLTPLYDEFPLLKYATNHWAYHISQASTDNPSLFSSLRLFCNRYMLQWIQAVALSNRLENLPTAARHLKTWIRNGRRQAQMGDSSPRSMGLSMSEAKLVEEWTVDLIHIVCKFGSNLARSPSSIHKNIPPLCPSGSIISRTYGGSGGEQGDSASTHSQLLSVTGLSIEDWDDNLARLSVSEDELASAIRCAGNYFLALIPHDGTVIVWHKETCEEVHRLHHGEWTTLLSTDKTGMWAATAGRFSFRVWELSTGTQLFKLPKTSLARTMSLDFAAKGEKKLLISYDDCTVTTYDLETAREEVIFQEPDQADNPQRSCPRFMSLSPDQANVAIAFRGRPVAVWDMTAVRVRQEQENVASPNYRFQAKVLPRICIRNSDKDLELDGQDVFNSPEVVRWQPVDGTTIYILYQDTTVLVWDLIEDTQVERGDTEAREMVLNNDGSFLLTSSNGGAVRVWALPKFHLIYELNSDEFVRDLTFSPDSQRFYDVRGSGCNVWAPDILIRPDSLDAEETSSSVDGSYVSEILSEPVLAKDQQAQRGHITALVTDELDEFFCVGRDDGAVNIHTMEDGKIVRKAYKHSNTVDITVIEWSLSQRFIASADDSGKVIAKRLRIKEDGRWAIYPMFNLRLSDTVTQLLFSQDETLLLISTESTDRLWDLKTKKETGKRRWASESRAGGRWLHHPHDPARLVWLSPGQVRVHTWADFVSESENLGILQEEEEGPRQLNRMAECSEEEDEEEEGQDLSLNAMTTNSSHGSLLSPPPGSSPRPSSPNLRALDVSAQALHRPLETIRRVLQPSNRNYILYESLPVSSRGSNDVVPTASDAREKSNSSVSSNLPGTRNKTLLHLVHLSHDGQSPVRRRPLRSLSHEIRYLLGCVRNKVVFIDHENWVCTASAVMTMPLATLPTKTHAASGIGATSASSIRRHFFLPRDWVNSMTLQLVTKKGTLLSARNGEVAILRYSKGF